MKRTALLPALVTGLLAALLAVGPAGALPGDDAKGPACANIVNGGFVYDGTNVTGSVQTEVPACTRIVYTLYVIHTPPGGTPTTTSGVGTIVGDSNVITFSVPVTDDDGTVCTYVTSGPSARTVFDRAPDSGCVLVNADPPGSTDYN